MTLVSTLGATMMEMVQEPSHSASTGDNSLT